MHVPAGDLIPVGLEPSRVVEAYKRNVGWLWFTKTWSLRPRSALRRWSRRFGSWKRFGAPRTCCRGNRLPTGWVGALEPLRPYCVAAAEGFVAWSWYRQPRL